MRVRPVCDYVCVYVCACRFTSYVPFGMDAWNMSPGPSPDGTDTAYEREEDVAQGDAAEEDAYGMCAKGSNEHIG